MSKDIRDNTLKNAVGIDWAAIDNKISTEDFSKQQLFSNSMASVSKASTNDGMIPNQSTIKDNLQYSQIYINSPIKTHSHYRKGESIMNLDKCSIMLNESKEPKITYSKMNKKCENAKQKTELLSKVSKKGASRSRIYWQAKEDEILQKLVQKYDFSWNLISKDMKAMGLIRSSKQVRDRFLSKSNSPEDMNIEWTEAEDNKLLTLYKEFGSKWHLIAEKMPGRNEMMAKNRFYKKFRHMMEVGSLRDVHSEDLTQINSNQDSLISREYDLVLNTSLYDAQDKSNREGSNQPLSLLELDNHYGFKNNSPFIPDRFFDSFDDFDQNESQSRSFSNIDYKTNVSQSMCEEASPQGLSFERYQERALIIIKVDEKIAGLRALLEKKLFSQKWSNFLLKVLDEYIFIKENINAFDSSEEVLRHMNVLKFCLCRFRSNLSCTIEIFGQQMGKA